MRHPSAAALPSSPAGLRRHVRVRTVRPDGTPVFAYDEGSGRPAVDLVHLDDRRGAAPLLPADHRHAHDFHVLLYVERGGGDAQIDDEVRVLRSGDLLAVPPGRVVGVGTLNPFVGAVWAVAFRFDAVRARPSAVAWTADPLLAAFPADGLGHLVVPGPQRRQWSAWLADLEQELGDASAPGSADAVAALVTRLLVASARLAADRTDARRSVAPGDPLVARVLELVEQRYAEPVGTADLARKLGYTAGHLTTVVRRRTGRTVLEWLTERRMSEARRLLLETDLPLSVIAGRVGYRDPAYLIRRFREVHGVTPERWRRATRAPGEPRDRSARPASVRSPT
jgi:AraC-like DNA-binding protein/mannose-6-phosphate isomerase-like protein (cupin superfamily)